MRENNVFSFFLFCSDPERQPLRERARERERLVTGFLKNNNNNNNNAFE